MREVRPHQRDQLTGIVIGLGLHTPQPGLGRSSLGERGGLQRLHFEQFTQARQSSLPVQSAAAPESGSARMRMSASLITIRETA